MATNLFNWLKQNLMSRGDCKKCLELLELIVDGEATKEEEQYFHQHIDQCLPCFETYNLESSIKNLLRTKIERKKVPDDLISSIKSKIRDTA